MKSLRLGSNYMTDAQKIEVWCAGKDWCAITATANLVAKKWHPVIIHRLLQHGSLGFNDLKEEVDGISSKVLSESLEDLEDKDLVSREVISEKPFRVRYSLTERGEDLRSVIREMGEWGERNLQQVSAEECK